MTPKKRSPAKKPKPSAELEVAADAAPVKVASQRVDGGPGTALAVRAGEPMKAAGDMHTIRTTIRPDQEITVSDAEYEQLLTMHLVYDGTPPDPVADPFDARVAEFLAVDGSSTQTAVNSLVTDAVTGAQDPYVAGLVADDASATAVALRAAYVTRTRLLREASARRQWRNPYPTTITTPSLNTTGANSTTSVDADPVYYPPSSAVFNYRGGHVKPSDRTQSGTRGNSYVQSDQSSTLGYFNAYAVEFETTAATVEFGYLGTSFPQFRVWIDDQLVSFTGTYPWATKLGSGTPFSPSSTLIQMSGTGFQGDNADHMARVTTNASRQLRKWRIECLNGLCFGGVWIERVDAIQPTAQGRPIALVLGDSFTTGAGADGQTGSFAHVAGRYLGYDIWPSGAGGTGYLQTNAPYTKLRDRLAQDCYRFDPDVIVVAMGVNDDAFTASAIGTEAAAVYADIATNKPDVPVVVVLPWRDAPGSVTSQFESDRRAAVRSAAQAAPNVVAIVDPTTWITGIGNVGTRTVADGATTSGSPTVTSATAAFTSSNVGNNVTGAGIPAGAYIGAVTNSTTATLYVAGVAANGTATATGVTLTFDNARRDGPADFMIGGDNLHPKPPGHEWLGMNVAQALANAVG